MTVNLTRARQADLPWLLAKAADYFDEIAPENEDFPGDYVREFFSEDTAAAWLIRLDDHKIGFALTGVDDTGQRMLSEFYILPDWRRRGLGKAAARALFLQWPGAWHFGVIAGSDAAREFWSDCLSNCPRITDHRIEAPMTDAQALSHAFTIREGRDAT